MVDARQSDEPIFDADAPALAVAAAKRASDTQTIRKRPDDGLAVAARRRLSGHKNVPAVQTGAKAGGATRADARGNPRRTTWRRAPKAYRKVT